MNVCGGKLVTLKPVTWRDFNQSSDSPLGHNDGGDSRSERGLDMDGIYNIHLLFLSLSCVSVEKREIFLLRAMEVVMNREHWTFSSRNRT